MRLNRNLSLIIGTCLALAVLSSVHAEESRNGLIVTAPNGYANLTAEDLSLRSTAGAVSWTRTWNGEEWKFNPQWESLSQSWKNLTGSQTQDSSGLSSGNSASSGVVLDTPVIKQDTISSRSSGGGGEGCWVWVDEDWQPTYSTEVVRGLRDAGSMVPLRSTPFNRVMNESGADYAAASRVNVDYSMLCPGSNASTSVSMEGIRRINELHLGENGRYSFNNRTVLEKRVVRQLASASTANLGTGQVALTLVSNDKGFRWIDRAGAWIDYNTQGQVVAYGDRNDNTVWLARDAGGILRGVVDATGRVLYTLHYAGQLVTEVKDYPVAGLTADLPARSVKYAYDERNRLTQVTDVRGNATRFDYDIANHIVKITDPEGHVEQLAYNGEEVRQRIAADGGVTDYAFDYDDTNKQFISKITGPETAAGRRVEDITQNRVGKLVRRLFNGQTDAEVRYDTGARAETVRNARGFSTRTTRNEFNQPVEVAYPDGTTVKYTYSALNLAMTESVDEAGVKTEYLRDAKGNLLKTTEAAGTPDERITEYELDALGQTVKITRKGRTEANASVTADAVWKLEFDSRGQVQKITDPEGSDRKYVFDRAGNMVSHTDPRGHVTRFEADASGHLIKLTDALGHHSSWDYDKLGNPVTYTNTQGKVTQAVYDAMGRAAQYINPLSGAFKVQYNAQSLPTQQTDEDGRTLSFEFDNLLRLTRRTDGLGNSSNYSYQIPDGSSAGQPGALQDPTEIQHPSFTQRLRYDARERPTSETLLNPGRQGTQNLVSSADYDKRGLAKSTTDAYGKTRYLSYDALGQLVESIDSLGHKTKAQYDARGNLLQLTDAKGNTSKFEYDRNDRLVKEIKPLGQAIGYAYDAAGNLSEKTDANGNKATYAYDGANWLSEVKLYKPGNVLARTTSYTWDDVGNLRTWTDIDATRNQQSSATLTYDDANRKTSETFTYPAGNTLGYRYAYSLAGKKTRLTWADGTAIDYGYSAHGELETVAIPGEGTVSVNQFKWTTPTQVTLPGGVVQEKSYDGLLNLEGLKVKNAGQQTTLDVQNTYGKVQELKQSSRTDAAGGLSSTKTGSYTYDDETRLIRSVVDAGGLSGTDTETFTLDAVSNRTAHSRVEGVWSYDANNRLKQRGTGTSSTTYAYDDAGNLTQKTEPGNKVTRFGYDTQNRLIEVKDGADHPIARYGYDPLSRRLWKEQYRDGAGNTLSPGRRTSYLYADEGLIAEAMQDITLNADQSVSLMGEPSITTQYGPRPNAPFTTGMLFIKTKNSNGQDTVGYYHRDHLDTPIQVTDKAGRVVWAASYNVFGQAQITTPAATTDKSTIASNLRLPGQYFDEETGLHYNWHRYYEPSSGSYTQNDPIGLIGGLNTYIYVNANPTIGSDVTGLFCISQNNFTTCYVPNGPTFRIPKQSGFPDYLGASSKWYHEYDYTRPIGCADPSDAMKQLINKPTPGKNARAATTTGTKENDASVSIYPVENLVTSYLTKDLVTGADVVVNIAGSGDGSAFGPGYVARYISGGKMHTAGEGTALKQWPFKRFQDWVGDDLVWGKQMEDLISKSKQNPSCRC